MYPTPKVKKIISYYELDNPGIKNNLARLMMHGELKGSGKLLIMPIDQGFEHGPINSFGTNPNTFNPHYMFSLATKANLSAIAAPIGVLEAGANSFAGFIPTILKLNVGNSLSSDKLAPTQSITSSVKDALRLGSIGVGFTIHPASDRSSEMFEDLREIIKEAKSYGLFTMVWCHPKGGFLSRSGEDAIDTISYAAHMAVSSGAHIIKLKMPTDNIEQPKAKKAYKDSGINLSDQASRIDHILQSSFNGKRITLFSSSNKSNDKALISDAIAIKQANAHGMVIGRELFQKSQNDALTLSSKLIQTIASE